MSRPPRARRGPTVVALGLTAVVALGGGVASGWAWGTFARADGVVAGPAASPASAAADEPAPGPTTPVPTTTAAPPAAADPTPAPALDLAAHSTTDPASPWVVVNKQHPLDPAEYAPADLVTYGGIGLSAAVRPDLDAMVQAAAAQGVQLGLRSGYRSYGAQRTMHAHLVAVRGTAYAERYSARPGFSEHQTGLALDVASTSTPACTLLDCFADTPEGRWLAEHAGQYGFLIRYTPTNSAWTGYAPEPWHLRWVGRELAAAMAARGLGSLEETFAVTGGAEYAG